MARTYVGSLVTLEPAVAAYPVGSIASLHIVGQATMMDGGGAAFSWHTKYQIYNAAGALLKETTRYHSVAPWTSVDTATDDFIIAIGAQVTGGLSGTVKMTAAG